MALNRLIFVIKNDKNVLFAQKRRIEKNLGVQIIVLAKQTLEIRTF